MLTANYDISVIVPIYNVEEYLHPCLDSLLRQGPVSLQVILIDDGSTDSSGSIADEYASLYDNFSCYHIANGGQGNARNLGVNYAEGTYLIFLDSDDIVPDHAYYKMFRIAERDGSDITICDVARFNSYRTYKSRLHEKIFPNLGSNAQIETDHVLLYDTCSPNKLIRRSFYADNGFSFPTNYVYEDIPFCIHLHLAAKGVSVLHEFGYLWRERESKEKSVTQKTSEIKSLQDRINAIEYTDLILSQYSAKEDLLFSWRNKLLTTDFMIFLNLCESLSDDTLLDMIGLISDYIRAHMKDSDFSHLDPVLRRKYDAVRDQDISLLRSIREYEASEEYSELEVFERDGRLIARLPEKLFGPEESDMSALVRPVRAEIISMEITHDRLSIEADFHRITPYIQTDILSAEISLYNEYSRQSIPMKTTVKKNGRVKAVLDADLADVLPVTDDPFRLRFRCKGRIFDDSGFLRFRGITKKGIIYPTVIHKDKYVCMEEYLLRYPAFFCRDNRLYMRSLSAGTDRIHIRLKTPAVHVKLACDDSSAISQTTGLLRRAETIQVDDLTEGIEYHVSALIPSDQGQASYERAMPVIYPKKKVSVLDTKTGFIVLITLQTGVPRLIRLSALALTSRLSFAGSGLQISTVLRGLNASDYVSSKLEVINREGEFASVITESGKIDSSGKIIFDISIEALKQFLETYDLPHNLRIRLSSAGGNSVTVPLYSTSGINEVFDVEGHQLRVFRNIHGGIGLAGI